MSKPCDLPVCGKKKCVVAVSEFKENSTVIKNYCSLFHAAMGSFSIWFDGVKDRAGTITKQTYETIWGLLLNLGYHVEKEWKEAENKIAAKKSA
jgi:hypothetical protein